MAESHSSSLLSTALAAAVPLHILELYEAGGITQAQFEDAQAFGQVLGEHGDTLLYGSRKPGETADLFNRLARTIAILAHAQGGVQTFGQHFDALTLIAGLFGEAQASAYAKRMWPNSKAGETPHDPPQP